MPSGGNKGDLNHVLLVVSAPETAKREAFSHNVAVSYHPLHGGYGFSINSDPLFVEIRQLLCWPRWIDFTSDRCSTICRDKFKLVGIRQHTRQSPKDQVLPLIHARDPSPLGCPRNSFGTKTELMPAAYHLDGCPIGVHVLEKCSSRRQDSIINPLYRCLKPFLIGLTKCIKQSSRLINRKLQRAL